MEFGKFISQALKITWQHKVLWLFAALPSILYFIPSLFFRSTMTPYTFQTMSEREMMQYFSQMAGLLGIQCLVGIASFLIMPISIGGLIKGVQLALEKKKLAFRSLFQESLHTYWRVLVLPLIAIVLVVAVVLVMVLIFGLLTALTASVSSDQNGYAAIPVLFVLMCCLYIVAIIGAVLLGIVFLLAYNGIVVDDLGIGEALSRAWGFIRNQFVNVFAATVIYGLISLVIFGVLYGVYFAVYFSTIGLGDFGSYEAMSRSMTQYAQGWIPIVSMLILYLFSAIFAVFFNALWTQTYQVLRDKAVPKRVVRKSTQKP